MGDGDGGGGEDTDGIAEATPPQPFHTTANRRSARQRHIPEHRSRLGVSRPADSKAPDFLSQTQALAVLGSIASCGAWGRVVWYGRYILCLGRTLPSPCPRPGAAGVTLASGPRCAIRVQHPSVACHDTEHIIRSGNPLLQPGAKQIGSGLNVVHAPRPPLSALSQAARGQQRAAAVPATRIVGLEQTDHTHAGIGSGSQLHNSPLLCAPVKPGRHCHWMLCAIW